MKILCSHRHSLPVAPLEPVSFAVSALKILKKPTVLQLKAVALSTCDDANCYFLHRHS